MPRSLVVQSLTQTSGTHQPPPLPGPVDGYPEYCTWLTILWITETSIAHNRAARDYLVKQSGYGDQYNVWEPERNFRAQAQELVQAFWASKQNQEADAMQAWDVRMLDALWSVDGMMLTVQHSYSQRCT